MDNMERKVTKIGNSYGITFPKELLDEAGISHGDHVQLELKEGEIIMRKRQELNSDFYNVLQHNMDKHEETISDLAKR